MNIGIIFAMDIEKDAFLTQFDQPTMIKQKPLIVYELPHEKHRIYAVKSGIGKANAAFVAGLFFDRFNIDVCLNTGISGGVDVNLGDVVIGTETVYFDVDVTAFSYDYGQIPELPTTFKADENLLNQTLSLSASDPFIQGTLTSGDQFVTSANTIAKIKTHFPNIKAVDMESTAIAQVAHLNQVPFIAFRTISDVIGSDDQLTDHDQRVETAINNGAYLLKKLCDVL